MNILIVKLSAIGDVIHALPVASALKHCIPEAKITWVVEKPAYDLLTNNPFIDEILVFDKPRFKSLSGLVQHAPAFIENLRRRRFDLALDLQGLFKSAAISYLSGAKTRYVYCNARELSHLAAKHVAGPNSQGHIVEQYLDVVRAIGCQVGKAEWAIYPSNADVETACNTAITAGISFDKSFVVFAPGANWPNKRWPVSNFAGLASWLAGKGIQPVVVGGPGDNEMASAIIKHSAGVSANLTGKTSLKQLAYIISKATALVGGDTGPMHLAAAMGTPTVALMGPTDIPRNGPYGQLDQAIATSHSCHGCWKRSCPKNLDCLAGISVEAVEERLSSILSLRGIM